MNLQVTLNSTYKYVVVEETYTLDITEEEVRGFLDDYETPIEDLTKSLELGQLVLNGDGTFKEERIILKEDCKSDVIKDVKQITENI